jgi:alkanesulfonate monooxygenase SsuD/methylene tetrahydromethanopterin reductase-like flavin-dependent oxidoreductase (luciferase family)
MQMISRIGRERGWPPPTREQFDATCGPEGAYLIGDAATVAGKMRDVSEALGGVGRLTFQMTTASLEPEAMKRSIELLGTAVAPIIRRGKKEGRH